MLTSTAMLVTMVIIIFMTMTMTMSTTIIVTMAPSTTGPARRGRTHRA
jgi:hypothetical protein